MFIPSRVHRESGTARRYRPTARTTRSGFTLVEALLALLILGFGLVAVARLQVNLLVESRHAKSLAEATTLARSQLESMRTRGHGAHSAERRRLAGQRTYTGLHETYTIEWESVSVPDCACAEATVQVFWNGPSRPNRVKLATLVAEPVPLVFTPPFIETSPEQP